MKKIVFAVTGSILLSVIVLLVACSQPVKSAESYLLKNAIATIQLNNWDSFTSDFKQRDLYNIFAENPAIKQFFEKLEQDPQLNKVTQQLKMADMGQLLGRKMELGIYPDSNEVDFILSAKLEDKQQFETIASKLSAEGTQPRELEKTDGAQIYELTVPNRKKPVYYYYNGKTVIVAGSRQRLKQTEVLGDDTGTEGMADDVSYRECTRNVSGDHAFTGYINMAYMIDSMPELAAELQKANLAFKSQQLPYMGAFIFTGQMVDKGLELQFYSKPKDPGHPIISSLLNVSPAKLKTMEYFPEDMIFVQASNQHNLKATWEHFKQQIEQPDGNVPPKAAVQKNRMIETLQSIENYTGINLESDVLDILGSEIAIGVTPLLPSGLFNIPQAIFVIGITDPQKVSVTMQRIELAIADKYQGTVFSDMTHGIHTIRRCSLSFVEPAYVVDGNYVLVASSSAVIKKLLDVKQGKESTFTGSAAVQALKTRVPEKVNTVAYLHMGKTAEVVGTLLEMFGPVIGLNQSPQYSQVQGIIEAMESLGMAVSYQTVKNKGIWGTSFIPMRKISQ